MYFFNDTTPTEIYALSLHDALPISHNAGGILVFDLPGLPQMGGHSTRVFHNEVVANDTVNFAPKGNTVAGDRKSTRLNSSHVRISYAVFFLKDKEHQRRPSRRSRQR